MLGQWDQMMTAVVRDIAVIQSKSRFNVDVAAKLRDPGCGDEAYSAEDPLNRGRGARVRWMTVTARSGACSRSLIYVNKAHLSFSAWKACAWHDPLGVRR